MRVNGMGLLMERGGVMHLNNVELTTLGGGTGAQLQDGGSLSIAASRIQTAGQGIVIAGTMDYWGGHTITVADSQLHAGGVTIQAKQAGSAVITLRNSDLASDSGRLFVSTTTGNIVLNASNTRMQGDVVVGAGGADFNLTNGSLWRGGSTGLNHLSLASGSQWHMQSSSDVQSLNNSGTVAFAPGAFNTLTVRGDLTGGGLFEMNTDLAAGRSDLLAVGGAATGTHQILVHNSGGEPSVGNQHQEIVRTEGGDARFSLANRGQVVDAGTYRYRLQSSDTVGGRATDWSLVHVGQVPTVVPLKPGGDLSTGANAAVNTGGIGSVQSIWYAEMNSLVKRLGELRLGNDRGGPWARAYRQRQLINNQGGRGFRQNVGGTELGADSRISTSNGRWYLGAMAGYSRADRKFADEGNGGTDSYHVGGYATYIANSGWYVDTVAKVNHMKHDFKVEATDGAMIKGNYKNQGVGVSVEAGRQVDLANGWFIEPQAELAVFRANSARYRLNNGMRVAAEGGSSVLLRVGSLVGRRLEMSNGNTVQPYVKIGWSQEFDGKSVVRTNGIGTRTDVSGGRAEVGAGVIAALGKDHRLYADYEYKKGSRFESPWAVNMGYRYTW
ncbi:hypothetical protein A9974_25775 [Achromobacter sp. UMC71]|nr:hypothetical protein [Achromobacter sp. UMC71]